MDAIAEGRLEKRGLVWNGYGFQKRHASSTWFYSLAKNDYPFFSSGKGILINATEPDEENFLDDPCNQWLLYPTEAHMGQTNGIGVVNLRDDYTPFKSSPDFIFPYKQFMEIYKGNLNENEIWLSELSDLIKANKGCIREILHDREPKNSGRISANEKRLNYVRRLAANFGRPSSERHKT